METNKSFFNEIERGQTNFFYLRMRDANEGEMKERMKIVLGYQQEHSKRARKDNVFEERGTVKKCKNGICVHLKSSLARNKGLKNFH